MLVGEEEHHFLILHAQFVVENFEVLPEGVLVVTSAEHDLKDFALGGEGGQSTDGLFPRATHTHQQSMALGHTKYAMYSRQMVQGVIE